MYPPSSAAPTSSPSQTPALYGGDRGGGATSPGASAYMNLLDTYTRDFRRLQLQKHRLKGGVEARVLLGLCMYHGEQYALQAHDAILTRGSDDDQKNRLFLVFNLIRKQVRRAIGRLTSSYPAASASPSIDSPEAFANADLVGDLVRALNYRLSDRALMWQRYYWMLLGGVAIEHTPWVKASRVQPVPLYDEAGGLMWKDEWTRQIVPQSVVEAAVEGGSRPMESFSIAESLQMSGDVGAEILGPLQFFIDQSIPLVDRLMPGQACYVANIRTVEWIDQTFGSAAAALVRSQQSLSMVRSKLLDRGPSMAHMSLRDLIPAISGSTAPDDPPQCLVLTRYSPPTKDRPRGSICIFSPDVGLFEEEDLAKAGYTSIPCVDFHYEPATATFWSGDFVTDLIPAQKFLNKRFSQLGEASNAQLYELILLGGDLSRDDIPSDIPGMVEGAIDENGNPLMATMPRGQLPNFFLESIRLITEFIAEVGGSDITSRKNFPGQLRGPLAVPMLQELIDSEWGPMFEHVGEQLGKAYTQRVERVKTFYPPIRTLHFTGPRKRNEVLTFHTDQILRGTIDYTITIDQSSLVPELSALREARIRERLNSPLAIVYVNSRTGMLDGSKIASDLKYGDQFRDSRASQYRRLAQDFISRMWRGLAVPEVQPFYDHEAMMDEYESVMGTIEFVDSSPEIQQLFFTVYEQHRAALQAQADAAQSAVESQLMQGAVAQATQQAAAKAASVATEAALAQVDAQQQVAGAGPGAGMADNDLASEIGSSFANDAIADRGTSTRSPRPRVERREPKPVKGKRIS